MSRRKLPEPASGPSKRTAPGAKPAKATPQDDDRSKLSQREKFIRTARELGCDESGEEFERAFSRAFPPRKPGEPVPPYTDAETPPKGSRRTKRPGASGVRGGPSKD
jgi:hypothetical protein